MKALDFSIRLLRAIRNDKFLSGRDFEILFAVANGIDTSNGVAEFYNVERRTAAAHLKRLTVADLIIATGDRTYKYQLSQKGKDAIVRTLSFLQQQKHTI